jgi:hypothetical protein
MTVVLTPDGEELGVRELLHDHAVEQPFTRSLEGPEIPANVSEVIVEAVTSDMGGAARPFGCRSWTLTRRREWRMTDAR